MVGPHTLTPDHCYTVFEGINAGLIIMKQTSAPPESDYILEWMNERARNISGSDISHTVGKSLVESFPGLRETGIVSRYDACLDSGSPEDLGTLDYGNENMAWATYHLYTVPLPERRIALIYENVTAARAADERLKAQEEVILELSTPIMEVGERLLLLPIVGALDSSRARQIIETLLEAIVEKRAKAVIVDMGGVAIIDTAVAQSLIRLVTATNLVGAQMILTGMRPDTASALVKLNFSLQGANSYASLADGLKEGQRIVDGTRTEHGLRHA